jgi:cell division protein FtsW
MQLSIDKYLKGDKAIWSIIILLSIISAIMAYSASANMAYRLTDGDAIPFFFRHFVMLVLGIVTIIYLQHFEFRYFSRLSQLGIWVAAALLLVTLIFGRDINSAQRWIMGFQPSDLAKVILVIYVARMLAKNKGKIKNFKEGLVPILMPVGGICLLILPADFSTAAMLLTVCFALLFVGGVAIKHLLAVLGGAIGVLMLLIALNHVVPGLLPRVNTWEQRILGYSSGSAEENYQAQRAKIAVANGGIWGNGPGNGTIKNELYSAQSDFVYASIIEDYGSLFGGLIMLLLYLMFLFRSIKIMTKTSSSFGGYLAFGLSFLLVFQALINMGVGVNLLPVTGQPLPLISMGGTSILFTCVSIGIILNISRTVYSEEETEG